MDDVDSGFLFSLIAGVVDIRSRETLHHQQRLAGDQHTAPPPAVEQLRLVRIDVGDQLHGGHLRTNTVLDAQSQPIEHDASRFEHRRLVERVHFEHTEFTLNDLGAGLSLGGLDGDIHRAENLVPGSHLDIQRCHTFHRQVTLGDGADKSRVLRLHAV